LVCRSVPPEASEYQRKVPADVWLADTVAVPDEHIVLFVTEGDAIAPVIVALTAARGDVHVPSLNAT